MWFDLELRVAETSATRSALGLKIQWGGRSREAPSSRSSTSFYFASLQFLKEAVLKDGECSSRNRDRADAQPKAEVLEHLDGYHPVAGVRGRV